MGLFDYEFRPEDINKKTTAFAKVKGSDRMGTV
jgi:hypothetical protein